jgi:hypothetical protein
LVLGRDAIRFVCLGVLPDFYAVPPVLKSLDTITKQLWPKQKEKRKSQAANGAQSIKTVSTVESPKVFRNDNIVNMVAAKLEKIKKLNSGTGGTRGAGAIVLCITL